MHILLIHQAFTSLDEAGGTRHAELSKYLAEQGHLVTIIASPVSYLTGRKKYPGDQKDLLGNPNITILNAQTYSKYNKSFFHRLLSFISFMFSSFFIGMKVKQVDVVWGTTPPIFQAFTAWLIARLKRTRYLLEVRDLWPGFAIALGVIKHPVIKWLSRGLEKFLYRHADRMIVNSPGFIEHIKSLGGKQVALIPNGADPDMFLSSDNGYAFRKGNGLEGKFVVTYAGAHGISNDLDTVLFAAEKLKDLPEVMLLLVGDGKEKPALMRAATGLNLTNIQFLDPLPKNKMADLLAASDACIAILKPIELYKTTYPNKVFDYMAAGKAVICMIDGEIRKVVESANAGLFVQPGDPNQLAKVIRSLQSQPEQVKSMGQSGKDYLKKNFQREKFAQEFGQIISEMVTTND